MQINLVLNKVQMKKYDGKLGFQLTAAQLHSDQPSNTRISFASMKDYKKYEKAFRTNKGLRITPDMYGHTGAEATPKAIPSAINEVDIEGGALFKKLGKSINKGVSKAKKAVSKKAKELDSDIKSKNTQRTIGRFARRQGKEALKDVARQGIAAPITYATGNPAVGALAADQIMSRSGADKKIDGLGFPIRGRGRPRAVNNGSNVSADGLTIPEHNENIRAKRIIKGTGFLNLT